MAFSGPSPFATAGQSAFGQPATAGQQPAQQATGMSAFGQAAQNQQSSTGGLFGQQPQGQQSTGGGLFGQLTQNQQQTSGSVFGQPTQQSSGNLFAQQAQNQKAAPNAFGQPTQPQQTGGGLFGQSNQTQQQSSVFGGGSTLTGTNLQGGTQAGNLGGAQGGQPSIFGSTVFNTNQQPQPTSTVFGATLTGHSDQQLQAQDAQSQPSAAYFDSLYAKSQKEAGRDNYKGNLPTLELGLGDLRNRLRKLQSKPIDASLGGKAHYLLAGSGVDPGAAVRDLDALGGPRPRSERPEVETAVPVDVEAFIANIHNRTTMSMIEESNERSLREFDQFLENQLAIDWDAQRKRIYEHFGIKPRQDSAAAGRESQAAFGRSRQKSQSGAPSHAARGSIIAHPAMQRSVIGSASRIGPHPSEFSDVDRFSESPKTSNARSAVEDRVQRERQTRLSEKVRGLNAARLLNRPYPILAHLAEEEQKSAEAHAMHVVDAYQAMIDIVAEDPAAETAFDVPTAKERQFASMYLDENPNSPQSLEMRKIILRGANQFLERQFMREVDALIAKHPHEAKLGGLPDVLNKIKAYIRLRHSRKDLVPDNTELQQVQGEYVWAIVFYLLRSGHINEAAQYVNVNSSQFKGIDRTFATYLNSYAASDDRRITNRRLLERCASEYIQRSRNAPDNSIDPFRMACYKVIGRVELDNRNFNNLNTDINDWIWLQFNLAREGDKAPELAGESYGLSELQASIKEIGLKHFLRSSAEETNSGSFGMFFYLQILAGLFEDAIAYLYPFSYVDAVHFGIALTYYGLLRPSDPLTDSNELRSHSVKNLPQINFGRMIGYYTRDFRAADVVSAVDYLTLICLNQDLGGEAGRRQCALCHEALRDLVLETREFSKLVGDIRPDGRGVRGIIEEQGPLIGLDVGDDFVNTVTLQAANFADDNGRTTDAVLLYHLAGEYDTVITTVSRALSEAVSLEIGEDPIRLVPVKPRVGSNDAEQEGSTLSLAAIDDPVELARTMMAMYERDAMFFAKIQEQNQVACRVLLEMSDIKKLVEAGQWAQGLDKIRGLDILPLDASGDAATVRAYAAKFSSLPQSVSINLPNLLMWTITCAARQREELTSGRFFSGNEGTRRMMADQLKQLLLDLTTYTSQLRYRFPPYLHEALARASAE